ncbi:MAG TPA: diguanylate cyclase [Pseudomonadales bacterium]|nr:diguanylate cyclase [Pseudomonadales bacterium]
MKAGRAWQGGSSQLAIGAALIGICLAAVLILEPASDTRTAPRVVDGVSDLRAWDFGPGHGVRLDGEWQYFPRQFVSPGGTPLPAEGEAPTTATVPGVWGDEAVPPGETSGHGFATYRVRVLLPADARRMGLRVITMATAFRLFVDDREVARVGSIATSREGFAAAYAPQIIPIDIPEDRQLVLTAQVANFDYARGGMWEPVWIGPHDVLQHEREGRVGLAMFLAGAFWLMGLYHLILWSTHPTGRSSLLFAGLCFAVGVRGLTVDEVYLVDLASSLPWAAVVRIEYGSMLLILAFAWAFVRELFPQEQPTWLVGTYIGASALGIFLIAVLPVAVFSLGLPIIQLVLVSAGMIAMVLVTRSMLRNRDGAALFLAGLLAIVAATIHDILISLYRDLPTIDVFGGRLYLQPFGLLVFMLSQAVMLAMRSANAVVELEETSEELRLARDAIDAHARDLERKVVERTRDLATANRELQRLAEIDGLTGIGNRRAFDRQLALAWSDHMRRGAPLALVMADVDHFKRYNDHYGHVAGDEALRRIAQRMAEAVQRPRDVVARYGGEELAAVLSDTPEGGARHLADHMRERIEALAIPHAYTPAGVVTASFGIASIIPTPGSSPEALIESADAALYRAKSAGRNRVASAAPGADVGADRGATPAADP